MQSGRHITNDNAPDTSLVWKANVRHRNHEVRAKRLQCRTSRMPIALRKFQLNGSWERRRRYLESGFFRSHEPKRGPIQAGVTTRNCRDHAIADQAYRRHRSAGFLGLGKRQAYVLQRQRHCQAGYIIARNDPVAINLVHAATTWCRS
jgi:hypothetical protein